MRNIFLFVRRYLNFLFFLLLQILALSMFFRYNKFHEAAFMNVAKEVTGGVYDKVNNAEYYFHLKRTNDSLIKENERLRNLLPSNFESPDTNALVVKDTIPYDTLGNYRKFVWRSARVSNNSTTTQNNFITIHRGENQGVFKDMAVISSTGVVGTVVNTSANYATVMSLLHRQSKLSASLKKSGETGTVQWDGDSPLFLTLINIPKSAKISQGDTILTSQYADRFPPTMVGTVHSIIDDKSSNFYVLKIRPATNFFSLQYVYVVQNMQADEKKKLEDDTKKKIQ
ncbi:MAG TPA: rod shape-determining protein MreC [Chitinophagaceae bacterium]|nr:rod shape-determining protein MreC [Chitinophagaceae bacterium]